MEYDCDNKCFTGSGIDEEANFPEKAIKSRRANRNLFKKYWSKIEFFITGGLLLISATFLIIFFPLYQQEMEETPIGFVMPVTFSTVTIYLYYVTMKLLRRVSNVSCPLHLLRLIQIVLTNGSGYLLIYYSGYERRTPCSLQDPLKMFVIIFSVVYYFGFSKRFLGQAKIVAILVVTFGLMIATHFSLSNSLRCRESTTFITVPWNLGLFWSVLYTAGLGLIAFGFTLMEEHIIYQPMENLFLPSYGTVVTTISKHLDNNGLENIFSSVTENYLTFGNTNSTISTTNKPLIKSAINFTKCLSYTQSLLSDVPKNTKFYINRLKESSFIITLWMQAFLCLILCLFSAFYYIHIAANALNNNDIVSDNVLDKLICHLPKIGNPQLTDVNLYRPISMDYLDSQDYYENRFRIGQQDNYLPDKLRNKRAAEEYNNHGTMHHKQHYSYIRKRVNKRNHQNGTTTIPLQELNSTMQRELFENRCNDSSHVKLIKNNSDSETGKNKRSSVQTNAMGFKIIQPTDSILQGHVITNKIKPELVGHVILNKIDINLSGHQITFKNDLFIREHDPLPSKNHRPHRGRPDVRFVNDMINITENPINKTVTDAMNKFNETSNDKNTHQRNKRSYLDVVESNDVDNKALGAGNRYDDWNNVVDETVNSRGKETLTYTTQTPSSATPISVPNHYLNILNYTDWKLFQKHFKSQIIKEFVNVEKESDNKEIDAKKDRLRVFNIFSNENVHNEGKWFNILNHTKNYDPSISSERLNRVPIKMRLDCGNTALYSWIVMTSYTVYSLTSVRFLILTQSSVMTIATMVPALPLSQIWWSLFKANKDGELGYLPLINKESVSSLIGLPIIIIGLILIIREHMKNKKSSNNSSQEEPMPTA